MSNLINFGKRVLDRAKIVNVCVYKPFFRWRYPYRLILTYSEPWTQVVTIYDGFAFRMINVPRDTIDYSIRLKDYSEVEQKLRELNI